MARVGTRGNPGAGSACSRRASRHNLWRPMTYWTTEHKSMISDYRALTALFVFEPSFFYARRSPNRATRPPCHSVSPSSTTPTPASPRDTIHTPLHITLPGSRYVRHFIQPSLSSLSVYPLPLTPPPPGAAKRGRAGRRPAASTGSRSSRTPARSTARLPVLAPRGPPSLVRGWIPRSPSPAR